MTILIYGADTFRSREKLKELESAFLGKHGKNITTLSGENLSLVKLRQAILGNSLFDAKRLVVISGLGQSDHDLDEIKKILRAAPKDNVIIMLEDKDTFTADHKYKFDKLAGRELKQWIIDFAKRLNLEFTSRGLSRLVEILGDDTWLLASEIQKLACLGKKIISEQGVDEVVSGSASSNVFRFIDALVSGQREPALKFLKQELEANDDPTRLFHLIIRQFRLILEAKDLDVKKLGLSSFMADKAKSQGAHWDLEKLKKIHAQFLDIDFRAKTGLADLKTMLTLLTAS